MRWKVRVFIFETNYCIITPLSSHPAPLTYSSVVHSRVVHPTEGLLHLALQGYCRLGWSHVGYGAVGFRLQGQQRRPNLLSECTGLRTVTFTPETVTKIDNLRERQKSTKDLI